MESNQQCMLELSSSSRTPAVRYASVVRLNDEEFEQEQKCLQRQHCNRNLVNLITLSMIFLFLHLYTLKSGKLQLQRDKSVQLKIDVREQNIWSKDTCLPLLSKQLSNLFNEQSIINSKKREILADYKLTLRANDKDILFDHPIIRAILPQVMYPDMVDRDQLRIRFHQTRFYTAKRNQNVMPNLKLSNYNFFTSLVDDHQKEADLRRDFERLNAKYALSDYKQELPFCVIIPSYNNEKNFRVELNLNSVFAQDYKNYHLVIIDDASTDATPTLIKTYLDFFQIPLQKYVFISNPKRLTALENIYKAIISHCNPKDIVITLDGDDEFIGRNVLKTLNAYYQAKSAQVVYSSFAFYNSDRKSAILGFNREYDQEVKDSNSYRYVEQSFSQLRTFKASLFLQIDLNDLKDEDGEFYRVAYDFAIMYPILELACGRVEWLPELQYLYNMSTGLNDHSTKAHKQIQTGQTILKKPRYSCPRI